MVGSTTQRCGGSAWVPQGAPRLCWPETISSVLLKHGSGFWRLLRVILGPQKSTEWVTGLVRPRPPEAPGKSLRDGRQWKCTDGRSGTNPPAPGHEGLLCTIPAPALLRCCVSLPTRLLLVSVVNCLACPFSGEGKRPAARAVRSIERWSTLQGSSAPAWPGTVSSGSAGAQAGSPSWTVPRVSRGLPKPGRVLMPHLLAGSTGGSAQRKNCKRLLHVWLGVRCPSIPQPHGISGPRRSVFERRDSFTAISPTTFPGPGPAKRPPCSALRFSLKILQSAADRGNPGSRRASEL